MKNQKFINYYKTLPRAKKERSKKRDLIISECGVTKSIFYNWYSGITNIPEAFFSKISKILGVPKSELFQTNTSN